MASLPDIVDFLLAASKRRLASGDASGASVLLEEVLGMAPDHQEALIALAEGRLDRDPHAAAILAGRVVSRVPGHPTAWSLLGRAVSALGRADEAVHAFSRAAQLAPREAAGHCNLSVALMRAGDPLKAIEAAQRGIELDPSLPEAFASLGHALNVLQRSEEAVGAYHRALGLRPAYPDALLGLARALGDQGRPSAAILALTRAVELSPGSADYQAALAGAYHAIGDLESAGAVRRKAAGSSGRSSSMDGNALLEQQYDPDLDDRVAFRAARDWGLRQIAATPAMPSRIPAAGPTPRKLRIGYVSGGIYRHPVGWLGGGPISSHNRELFHITVYANQTCADELTAEVRGAVDAWTPILALDDETVASRIVADQIDILVDLCGHTAGNRLGVFARRPAPVQVSWLGYFATTGLPTIDHVLLDDDHLVPGAEALFVEKVVRLPRCRFCYKAPAYAGPPAPPPLLTSGRVTFGSFNNTAKINPRVIALWARILERIPESGLLLKWRSYADPILQARTRNAFEQHGIDPRRVEFAGATPHTAMLAEYSRVDIALDPFPFSGGLTSCEALWMGVPVLTLPGSRPVSRQTHSILRCFGRSEFSLESPEQFIETAVSLAHDADRLAAIRNSLRSEMSSSPLCDVAGCTATLEAVYQDLFRRKLNII
jgi:predicted O-linked N-acetylglucosamine transferase (SPINDLY family)